MPCGEPWSAEATPNCFVVHDANGQQLAYVYYENELGRRCSPKDEARRIAATQQYFTERLCSSHVCELGGSPFSCVGRFDRRVYNFPRECAADSRPGNRGRIFDLGTSTPQMAPRRFPSPWSVEEQSALHLLAAFVLNSDHTSARAG